MKLKIEREVQPKEIAYLLFGTGLWTFPWWGSVTWGHVEDGEDFIIEHWDTLEEAEEDDFIIVRHDGSDSPEGAMDVRTRLTFQEILTAAGIAIRKGYVSEPDAIKEDLGMCDAVEADAVLQVAVFGDAIFG